MMGLTIGISVMAIFFVPIIDKLKIERRKLYLELRYKEGEAAKDD